MKVRVKYTYKSALFAAFLAVACGPSAPAVSAPKDVLATNLTTPTGTQLAAACTPTGPELCFNAIDDNCNGIIDEGCGQNTGQLQFMIAWGDSKANVDLEVDGVGGKVGPDNPSTQSGLQYEKDCPGLNGGESCNGQNVENIYFNGTAEPPKGKYEVRVILKALNGAPTPVLVRWGARVGSRSYGADVELTKEGEVKPFSFTLQ
jgi:tRNA (guanosine-2'-O-)-methyltransferase